MSLVLIAEDSPSVRLLLVRRLEMAGHEVIEAHNGDQAVAMVEIGFGTVVPDIVLLDAMMPNANGAEILERIKRIRPDLPVLVVSAMQNLNSSEEWRSADGRLSKPIDFDDLLGRIGALTS
ncbi:MAG: response regulator transcription factor [Solirubrobacterales bacterium]